MEISAEQRQELERASRTHPIAYLRVKALALLNLARGRQIAEVAGMFLVSRQSVYAWVERYLAHGLAGLSVRPGRGRKAKADPKECGEYVRQAPENFGVAQTRWTLKALVGVVPSLRGYSPSGATRVLARAGLGYKRGQPALHSPDPEYAKKKSRSKRRWRESGPHRSARYYSTKTN